MPYHPHPRGQHHTEVLVDVTLVFKCTVCGKISSLSLPANIPLEKSSSLQSILTSVENCLEGIAHG